MKKTMLLLSCILALCLCACAQEQPTVTTTDPIAATTTDVPTTAEQTTATDAELMALAQSCVGKSVTELYALIGEPASSDYAKSCLGEGDDGNLYYQDFVVYTYREGDTETVRFVE